MDERLVDIIDHADWKIMLYDLVKSNDFDVWNVDLVKLVDLYINKIKSLKLQNLIVPANALVAATILLKLKASSLKLTSVDDTKELTIPSENLFENSMELESPLRIKEGQVSLDELIGIVEQLMNTPTKTNISRQIKENKDTEFFIPRPIEDINTRIDNLFSIIYSHIDSEKCTCFSELRKTVDDPQKMIDFLFVPLLFLNQHNKINIWQDDFFSDIYIKVL
ncbi:MAG TPA: segregation/condensation protein A [archaeon]|nr:segregation/condensation protein A [archaeon]HPC09934.1 segregation/condensation protein A [archaeon]